MIFEFLYNRSTRLLPLRVYWQRRLDRLEAFLRSATEPGKPHVRLDGDLPDLHKSPPSGSRA